MANPSGPSGTMKNKGDDRSGGSGNFGSGSGSEAKNKGHEEGGMVDKAKEMASSVADKAKDAASSVADRAKDAASMATHHAGQMASALGDRAESATAAVGSGMKTLADSIRTNTPDGGVLGGAASKVADYVESSGDYLQERGLGGMGEDLTNMVRRNPLPALFIGIGIGFLIAKATSSRS